MTLSLDIVSRPSWWIQYFCHRRLTKLFKSVEWWATCLIFKRSVKRDSVCVLSFTTILQCLIDWLTHFRNFQILNQSINQSIKQSSNWKNDVYWLLKCAFVILLHLPGSGCSVSAVECSKHIGIRFMTLRAYESWPEWNRFSCWIRMIMTRKTSRPWPTFLWY